MLKRLITIAFPIIVAGTALTFIVYGAVQQDMRQTANFLPQELAENAAHALENGAVPAAVVPREIIDVTQSLSPFVMVFDEQSKILESSMKMGSDLPTPPAGIFDYVRNIGEERILTWQPMRGVHLATTVIHWKSSVPPTGGAISSGFVLAGHSLRQVEDTYQRIGLMILAGWLAMVVGTIVAVILPDFLVFLRKESAN